jgi:Cu-processing system permease protein
MNQIWVIASLTFREAIRRRIVMASLILGGAFLVLFSVGFHYITAEFMNAQSNMNNPSLYIQQMYNFLHLAAMYATNFLTIATGALITADTLAGEISSGTIQTILAKPIRRYQIVLGKWLGSAALLAAYILMMAGGSSLSIYLQSGYSAPNLLSGFAFLLLNGLLIMTITLAFSSRMSTLAAGGSIFGLFGLAFIGGWVERIGYLLKNQTAINVGILSSLLMPSESVWNMASFKMTSSIVNALGPVSPFSVGSQPSNWMLLYTIIYLAAFFAYAARTFSNRDL